MMVKQMGSCDLGLLFLWSAKSCGETSATWRWTTLCLHEYQEFGFILACWFLIQRRTEKRVECTQWCGFNIPPFGSFQGGWKLACVPMQIWFQEVKICVHVCIDFKIPFFFPITMFWHVMEISLVLFFSSAGQTLPESLRKTLVFPMLNPFYMQHCTNLAE